MTSQCQLSLFLVVACLSKSFVNGIHAERMRKNVHLLHSLQSYLCVQNVWWPIFLAISDNIPGFFLFLKSKTTHRWHIQWMLFIQTEKKWVIWNGVEFIPFEIQQCLVLTAHTTTSHFDLSHLDFYLSTYFSNEFTSQTANISRNPILQQVSFLGIEILNTLVVNGPYSPVVL